MFLANFKKSCRTVRSKFPWLLGTDGVSAVNDDDHASGHYGQLERSLVLKRTDALGSRAVSRSIALLRFDAFGKDKKDVSAPCHSGRAIIGQLLPKTLKISGFQQFGADSSTGLGARDRLQIAELIAVGHKVSRRTPCIGQG